MMFYLSNIARYQPHLWRELLIGRKTAEALLVRHFIETSEKRFPCLFTLKFSASGFRLSMPSIRGKLNGGIGRLQGQGEIPCGSHTC